MTPARYPGLGGSEEFALAFDGKRQHRVLIVPALFDEGSKLRRLTVEVMRRLDGSGIDAFLPDLPGCHESLSPLQNQTLESWREVMSIAADSFRATHILSLRAGAVIAPVALPGWRYAPTGGSTVLKGLLRARTISAREAGLNETRERLLEAGLEDGLVLAGYALGPAMLAELDGSRLPDNGRHQDIAQSSVGGPGLWLRNDPGDDANQADALAALVAMRILG